MHDSVMALPNRAADIVAYLSESGGVGERHELVAAVSYSALRSALECGWVSNLGSGLFVLPHLAAPPLGNADACRSWTLPAPEPSAEEADHIAALLALARSRRGVLSHRSAAIAHRWSVLQPPKTVELAFVRGRRFPSSGMVPITGRHRAFSDDERRNFCTSPLNTVLDCARDLPRAEALAIADSALRTKAVTPTELARAGERYEGRHAPRVRWITRHADGGAANPFESALRAILIDVRGVEFQTQVQVDDSSLDLHARVDLGVETLRLAVEADSFEFHGGRENFHTDRRRYALLTAAGWIVLTFTLRQVLEEPEWIHKVVTIAVEQRRNHVRAEQDAAAWRRLRRKRARSLRRRSRNAGAGDRNAA